MVTWKELTCAVLGHRWHGWRRIVTCVGGLEKRRECCRCGNVDARPVLNGRPS